MKLAKEDSLVLAGALEHLLRNDSRAFHDALWIGFGDDWVPTRGILLHHKCIECVGEDRYELTCRGEDLLNRLRESTERAGMMPHPALRAM